MAIQTFEERRLLRGATPQEAFAYVTTPANKPAFIPGVLTAESDGLQPGAVLHTTSTMMGLTLKGEQEIREVDEPNRYVLVGHKPFPTSFDYQFVEVDGGTELRLSVQIEPIGMPGGGLVAGRFLKKQISDIADTLETTLSR